MMRQKYYLTLFQAVKMSDITAFPFLTVASLLIGYTRTDTVV